MHFRFINRLLSQVIRHVANRPSNAAVICQQIWMKNSVAAYSPEAMLLKMDGNRLRYLIGSHMRGFTAVGSQF